MSQEYLFLLYNQILLAIFFMKIMIISGISFRWNKTVVVQLGPEEVAVVTFLIGNTPVIVLYWH